MLINSYRFAVVSSYDTDAQTYINAVEAADAAAGASGGLETATKDAINAFVVGCKADGIWNAIKASCILAGARTLAGALVPLVGTAPTNVGGNFVSGDYNRKTGLVGNGSSKYLNSNRANNADPQNSQHISAYVSTAPTSFGIVIGGGSGSSYVELGYRFDAGFAGVRSYCRNASSDSISNSTTTTGLIALSRANSTQYTGRANGTPVTFTKTSAAPGSTLLTVFAENDSGTIGSYSNARLAFYSIGESLILALLDARVTALINAINAAF